MRSAVQGLPQWWRHDSRRCACMWARPRPWQGPVHCHTTHWRESVLFSRVKKWKSSLARNDGKSWESSLSSLSFSLLLSLPLSLSLSPLSFSLSLSLSLRFSLSLSLSLSLSQGTHTQKNCRVNAHPYGGPTDFASNCIHLGGWDSWSIVTVESTHNPPEPPKASPLPIDDMRVGQRSTTRSLSTTTMTGCKTAPKPEPPGSQAIRYRIHEM